VAGFAMTWKEAMLWVLAIIAYVAAFFAVVHYFDLSRTQGRWLEVMSLCVFVVGFVAYTRLRRRE
jgi:hypothetical protein